MRLCPRSGPPPQHRDGTHSGKGRRYPLSAVNAAEPRPAPADEGGIRRVRTNGWAQRHGRSRITPRPSCALEADEVARTDPGAGDDRRPVVLPDLDGVGRTRRSLHWTTTTTSIGMPGSNAWPGPTEFALWLNVRGARSISSGPDWELVFRLADRGGEDSDPHLLLAAGVIEDQPVHGLGIGGEPEGSTGQSELERHVTPSRCATEANGGLSSRVTPVALAVHGRGTRFEDGRGGRGHRA